MFPSNCPECCILEPFFADRKAVKQGVIGTGFRARQTVFQSQSFPEPAGDLE